LIGLELFSNVPIQSTAGGSLVTVALQVREQSPDLVTHFSAAAQDSPLTLVNYVDPSGGLRVFQTQVSDGRGAFVLDVQSSRRAAADGAASLGASIAVAKESAPAVFDQTAGSAQQIADSGQVDYGARTPGYLSTDAGPSGVLVEVLAEVPSSVRDLALSQTAVSDRQAWTDSDYRLPQLGEPELGGFLTLSANLMDDGAPPSADASGDVFHAFLANAARDAGFILPR
jgi:hypothetical protein